MKFTNFSAIFKKNKNIKESGKFADFFLHAPIEKKIEVFREAAQKANKDQRETFERSKVGLKTR